MPGQGERLTRLAERHAHPEDWRAIGLGMARGHLDRAGCIGGWGDVVPAARVVQLRHLQVAAGWLVFAARGIAATR